MIWEELNWMEFEKLVPEKYDTVIVPVGTIEAHGVSPLGTDNFTPIEIAKRIAEDIKAIIAPPIHYGITNSLLAYPGSLSVKPETFQNYMIDLLVSITEHKFKKMVILNGHGGQTKEFGNIAKRVWEKTKIKITVVEWWLCCSEIVKEIYGRAGGHAATDENAAIQAIRPDLIKSDLYSDEMVYNVPKGFKTYPAPGTILAYEQDAGAIDFDQKKAEIYFEKVLEYLKEQILEIFKRWERLQ